MILASWFTRGHWRETGALLAEVCWYMVGWWAVFNYLVPWLFGTEWEPFVRVWLS